MVSISHMEVGLRGGLGDGRGEIVRRGRGGTTVASVVNNPHKEYTCTEEVASFPGLLTPGFVACSTNTGGSTASNQALG